MKGKFKKGIHSRTIQMKDKFYRRRRFTAPQIILLGFAAVILIGALLLMLPISTCDREGASFGDALFTSTSAVCVTGLVVRDTGSYFSVFGQCVILLLIQIGGLGVVTVLSPFFMLTGRGFSLGERSIMLEASTAPNMSDAVRFTAFAAKITFSVELIGALALLPVFCSDFGAKGIFMALFHSVSAFCNAGFDILGSEGTPFASLMPYAANAALNIPIMLLIVLGGIGFLTWRDVFAHKHHLRKYSLQSKMVLLATGLLILLPALYFFFFEFSTLPFGERLLVSLFQAVTPRTAGFNTVSLTLLSGAGAMIMVLLMLIGGSPGSTAGGMKTTTFAVLFSNMIAVFRRKKHVECFGRRLPQDIVKQSATILILYLSLFFVGAILISAIDTVPIVTAFYEAASAVGTVGLTLGITPTLGSASRIVLMLLMYFGRVGGLTMIYAAVAAEKNTDSKFPEERITVG